MSALASLAPFVEALAIAPDGTVTLGGRAVGRAEIRQEQQLAAALSPIVYEHAYTRPYPPPPAPAGEEADLTPFLEAANTTRSRSEQGWVLFGIGPDGSAMASRNGRTRRFAPGQFVALPGTFPAQAGAPLAVYLPSGSAVRQPGFYYCFSEGFRDANDLSPIVRLYFHTRAEAAPQMVAALTAALNRYEIPFDLKVVTARSGFVRSDNSVLYLSEDSFAAAALALAAVLPVLSATLAPDVPLFTKQLAPGIGFAEDPGGGDSFGMNRSRLVAQALAASIDDGRFDPPRFEAAFRAAVEGAKLDIDRLWLNPNSKDVYLFPLPSPLPAAA
jgi:hypothetical protein